VITLEKNIRKTKMYCTKICIDCENIEEKPNGFRCSKGYFDVKFVEGLLLTPLDFECIDYEEFVEEKND
jgi:hypothetical protein